jgi:DNA-binding NtrC family response regulator
MSPVAQRHIGGGLPVSLVSRASAEGLTLLRFDCETHHAAGPRARALVFDDPRSRAILPLIAKVAPSLASVLVIGETGTGKELVARYVHEQSRRAAGPFVAVNCGAFSETLTEGELFGHERGAFTGAHAPRPGWFEAANGGTLFLDEIGEMPLSAQVKLLRVLQEREVVRLGSRTPVALDVRVIAGTNVDLAQAVAQGHFRADLYYRLQVVTLPLLPLRERRGDILPLARHFLAHYGAQAPGGTPVLSPAAEAALAGHAWPGNIRELENAVQRAVLVCDEGRIEPEDLGLGQRFARDAPADPNATLEDTVRPFVGQLLQGGHSQLLDRLIGTAVTEAFHRSGANQIKTAETLGVTRNVVRTYLKNLALI